MVAKKPQSIIESTKILFLPPELIRPNPAQPRRIFDEEALQELAASIAAHGILQPLTIRRRGANFELVAGERRLRAAKLAGLREVPCIMLSVDEEQSGLLALIENLQRRDLDFIEEAEGILRLIRQHHLSQEQAARRLGKSQSAIANKLRILKLSPAVLSALREHALSERHARALLRLPDASSQLQTAQKIAEGNWSVARTEQYIEALLHPPVPKRELGSFLLRDARVFLNAVHHHLRLVRSAGISACSDQQETEQEIILTIRIPKHSPK